VLQPPPNLYPMSRRSICFRLLYSYGSECGSFYIVILAGTVQQLPLFKPGPLPRMRHVQRINTRHIREQKEILSDLKTPERSIPSTGGLKEYNRSIVVILSVF
jgi:hypothetical protein